MERKPSCAGRVHYGTWGRTRGCELPIYKQDSDGVWWCGTHHPDAVAARKARREEKWRQEEARLLLRRRSENLDARKVMVFPDLVKELRHLVQLVEPFLEGGGSIPGLATLNAAKGVLLRADTIDALTNDK